VKRICLTGQVKSLESQKLEQAVVERKSPPKLHPRSRLKLEEMLDKLGPMKELDWGEPVGKESW
jgi:hypothetical protein